MFQTLDDFVCAFCKSGAFGLVDCLVIYIKDFLKVLLLARKKRVFSCSQNFLCDSGTYISTFNYERLDEMTAQKFFRNVKSENVLWINLLMTLMTCLVIAVWFSILFKGDILRMQNMIPLKQAFALLRTSAAVGEEKNRIL